jgi:hypothetical protein
LGIAAAVLTGALIAILVLGVRWWLRERHFVWRTADITASILRDDEYLKIGQFLNLNQRLRPNESGWTNMKINLPEHWIVRTVDSNHGRVTLTLLDGAVFHLNRRNVGPLSFDILDGGGDKSDMQLEAIWRKYASADAA